MHVWNLYFLWIAYSCLILINFCRLMFTQDKCLINVTLHSFYHTILPSPFVSGDKSYDIARLYLLHHYLQYIRIFSHIYTVSLWNVHVNKQSIWIYISQCMTVIRIQIKCVIDNIFYCFAKTNDSVYCLLVSLLYFFLYWTLF